MYEAEKKLCVCEASEKGNCCDCIYVYKAIWLEVTIGKGVINLYGYITYQNMYLMKRVHDMYTWYTNIVLTTALQYHDNECNTI